jgi:hypothetical protein
LQPLRPVAGEFELWMAGARVASAVKGHEDEEPESKEIRSLCQPNVAPKSLGLLLVTMFHWEDANIAWHCWGLSASVRRPSRVRQFAIWRSQYDL